MTAPIPTFAQYVTSLGRLTPHVDPTLITPESEQIRAAAQSLVDLAEISRASLAAKGFDSTGSKLTDAVREVEEMRMSACRRSSSWS